MLLNKQVVLTVVCVFISITILSTGATGGGAGGGVNCSFIPLRASSRALHVTKSSNLSMGGYLLSRLFRSF